MRVTRIILILASIALIASFFLPYFARTDEESNEALTNAVEAVKPFESVDISGKDLVKPSLLTYTRIYFQGREEIFRDPTEGLIYAGLYCIIPLFGLLMLIFALCKKPIPILIFSILVGIAAYAVHWDFEARGIISTADVAPATGYYLIYACVAILFIVSICMIVAKSKAKKINT